MNYKVIIYSGGMDSYTLLHSIHQTWKGLYHPDQMEFHALSFNYGQRHDRELICAKKECIALGIKHTVIHLPIADMLKGSALTDKIDMPEGKYDDENMRLTVVPGRNTLMLAMALAYAEGLVLAHDQKHMSKQASAHIYYGAHAGDHYIYPDCRPDYIESMAQTIRLASNTRVALFAPYQQSDKGDILAEGISLGLDYANTWTCYKGGQEACGVCGSCDERLEAFVTNNMRDPVPYSSYGRWAPPDDKAQE
jgi:7-cyano-7-deazaguanine synthase